MSATACSTSVTAMTMVNTSPSSWPPLYHDQPVETNTVSRYLFERKITILEPTGRPGHPVGEATGRLRPPLNCRGFAEHGRVKSEPSPSSRGSERRRGLDADERRHKIKRRGGRRPRTTTGRRCPRHPEGGPRLCTDVPDRQPPPRPHRRP